MATSPYQIRFVKEIRSDGTLITFPELGHGQHGEKTLKNCKSVDEAVKRALEYNRDLPARVKGMVIVGFRAGGQRISAGKKVKPYVGGNPRKVRTTVWHRFIDRGERQSEVTVGRRIRR